jgi:hypothetical protein
VLVYNAFNALKPKLWFERIGVGEQNVSIVQRLEAEPVAAADRRKVRGRNFCYRHVGGS